MISSCSLRLLSGLELFEFLDTSISTALWTVFMCLFKFRFALNDLLHTEQFTLAWSCWCFWCWCWFKKDLGFSLHAPAMHIHRISAISFNNCKKSLTLACLWRCTRYYTITWSSETFGETLLTYSDEVCESMHSQIRLFEDAHRYINNKKGSISHKNMQHRSTVHLNSLNLGDR